MEITTRGTIQAPPRYAFSATHVRGLPQPLQDQIVGQRPRCRPSASGARAATAASRASSASWSLQSETVMIANMVVLGRAAQPMLQKLEGAAGQPGSKIRIANEERAALVELARTVQDTKDLQLARELMARDRESLQRDREALEEVLRTARENPQFLRDQGMTDADIKAMTAELGSGVKRMQVAELMRGVENIVTAARTPSLRWCGGRWQAGARDARPGRLRRRQRRPGDREPADLVIELVAIEARARDASVGRIGHIEPGLRIYPPVDSDAGRSYTFEAGVEKGVANLPKEATPTQPLVRDDISNPGETPKLGGVSFRDLTLGDHSDLFRFTLERTSATEATFGIAGVNESGGVAADGFTLVNPLAADRIVPVAQSPVAASFRLTAGPPPTWSFTIESPRSARRARRRQESREHFLTLTGPAVPDGERTLRFYVRQNRFTTKWARSGTEREATTAALAVGGLANQAAQGSVSNVLARFLQTAESIRADAAEKELIPKEMYGAWDRLFKAMIELEPLYSMRALMTPTLDSISRRTELKDVAATAADELSGQLSTLTMNQQSERRTSGGPGGWGYVNTYTEAKRQRFEKEYRPGSGTLGLGAALRADEWDKANGLFEKLRSGFDRYIATKLDKTQGDTLLYTAGMAQELGKVMREGDGTPEGEPRRVLAVFLPDSKFEIEASSPHAQVPLQLYTWRSGGKWHLRDVTNPNKIYNDDVPAEGMDKPPRALFEKLNCSTGTWGTRSCLPSSTRSTTGRRSFRSSIARRT